MDLNRRWSYEQHCEAAHVFAHGILVGGQLGDNLATSFHEWCEMDRVPKAERNAIWEQVKPLVTEDHLRDLGYYDADPDDEQ